MNLSKFPPPPMLHARSTTGAEHPLTENFDGDLQRAGLLLSQTTTARFLPVAVIPMVSDSCESDMFSYRIGPSVLHEDDDEYGMISVRL